MKIKHDFKSHQVPPIKRLHEQILELYNYLEPTNYEFSLRLKLIEKVKNTVLEYWPKAEVEIFGSFSYGLYLPLSDIDIVVFGKWEVIPLWTMKTLLLDKGISNPEDVQVLENAKVPLVKFKDKLTDINVDICFNLENGLQTSHVIKILINKYPFARPLIVLLKLFLLQRELNEVFTGGLSSYSLTLMVFNFIQNHTRLFYDINYLNLHSLNSNQSDIGNLNLGVLLIEFFEFFGKHLNYYATGIRVFLDDICHYDQTNEENLPYYYFPKSEYAEYISSTGRTSLLCIQDPVSQSNDTAKSSWAFGKLRSAFEFAYVMLSRAVLPAFYEFEPHTSPLSQIIRVPKDIISFRKRLYMRQLLICESKNALKQFPIKNYSDYPTKSNHYKQKDHKSPKLHHKFKMSKYKP